MRIYKINKELARKLALDQLSSKEANSDNKKKYRECCLGQVNPLTNIKKNDQGYEIELFIPGLKKEDFNIMIDNDLLKVKVDKEENDEEYTRKEFDFSKVEKVFELSENIEKEDIKASYSSGILHIELKLQEKPKPKKIEIA